MEFSRASYYRQQGIQLSEVSQLWGSLGVSPLRLFPVLTQAPCIPSPCQHGRKSRFTFTTKNKICLFQQSEWRGVDLLCNLPVSHVHEAPGKKKLNGQVPKSLINKVAGTLVIDSEGTTSRDIFMNFDMNIFI